MTWASHFPSLPGDKNNDPPPGGEQGKKVASGIHLIELWDGGTLVFPKPGSKQPASAWHVCSLVSKFCFQAPTLLCSVVSRGFSPDPASLQTYHPDLAEEGLGPVSPDSVRLETSAEPHKTAFPEHRLSQPSYRPGLCATIWQPIWAALQAPGAVFLQLPWSLTTSPSSK